MSPFKFHGGTFRWCSCAAAVRGFWCSGTDNSVFRSGSSFKRSYLHFDLFLIIHQPEMFCHTYIPLPSHPPNETFGHFGIVTPIDHQLRLCRSEIVTIRIHSARVCMFGTPLSTIYHDSPIGGSLRVTTLWLSIAFTTVEQTLKKWPMVLVCWFNPIWLVVHLPLPL